jgi:RHS repeat-associated protein
MLMTYDNAGQLKTNTSPAGVTLTYTYDAAHNLLSVTDELGNHIDYTYDLKGNQAEEKIYDASNVLKRTLTKTYDIRDNIDTINNGSSITDLLFDALGNLDSETDANLNATTNNYDPLNRLTDTLDALSGSTVYGYDVTDNLTSVHAPNGALTTYEYDDLGNLLSESSPDRGQIFYTHDIAGNVVGVTDARGVTTTYSYDVLNRVTKTQYPDASENVTYTFDTGTSGIARLAAIADQSGITSYGYNTFGDVVSDVKVIDGVSYTTSYLYDGAGNITDITYPDGRIVSYVRDAAGQLTQVNTSVDSVTTAIISNAAYEPFGPVTSMTYANGVSMDYAYDQAYRVTGITMNGLLDKSYGLDPVGNILGITDLVDPAMNQSFTYDALNRLETDQGNYAGDAFTYDANGNRTSDSSGTYDYLSLSNRLIAIAGESVVLDAAGNTTSLRGMDLAYNDSGRLQSVSAAVTTKYRGKPKTTITKVGVYTYNALGHRVKKIANGRSTIYHYDLGGNLILETTDGGVAETSYLWLGNRPVAQIGLVTKTTTTGRGKKKVTTTTTEERLTFLHNDHLATVRTGTDDTGKIVWRWDGDGFGGVAADGDPDGDGSDVTVNLRFPGQYFDAETGFHYNYYRTYDPGIGRYVQSDPIGLAGGPNTYAYVGANPTNRIDPYGLVEWTGYITYEGHGLGATRAFFNWYLESECYEGEKLIVTLFGQNELLTSLSVGAGSSKGFGEIRLVDPYKAPAVSNLSRTGYNRFVVENFSYVLYGGFNVTLGDAVTDGWEWGWIKGGIDLSLGRIAGNTEIVSSEWESCGCEN